MSRVRGRHHRSATRSTRALDGVDAQVLVNNAGIGIIKPFLELTRDEWRRMVDVNFNAMFDVTRAVLPPMIARKSGHVVVVGSITGRTAYPGGACYSATKHAVMGLTESLMLELREYGVKVSIVNPGSVATHFSERSRRDWMLAPDDVAEAIARIVDTPPDVLVHRIEMRTLTVPRSTSHSITQRGATSVSTTHGANAVWPQGRRHTATRTRPAFAS